MLSRIAFAAVLGLGTIGGAASAADLRIGTRTEITTLDPMFDASGQNLSITRSVFESLVLRDARQHLVPGLALSWQPISDDTWEVKLRPGVTYQDGTPFVAEDVAYSFERVKTLPSTISYRFWASQVDTVSVIDPLTVHIRTKGPEPSLPNDLSMISIVSRQLTEGKSTADFNRGGAAIGTGPYKLVEWVPNDHLTLARNAAYWGGAEPWDRVTFKAISVDAARSAALLAGDVDLIERVPPDDVARLRATSALRIASIPSSRIIFMIPDVGRDHTPGITDHDGKPLDHNPLRDLRVRQAISAAINRDALVQNVLDGEATPAGQMIEPNIFGASDKLPPDKYDPARAKRLLDAAGYPQGFQVVLAATNDRYPKDAAIAQAVAQMLTRVGIVTSVDAQPTSIMFARGQQLAYSLQIMGGGVTNGEPTASLRTDLATHDPEKSYGAANRGRYSNPILDETLAEAMRTFDIEKRRALVAQVGEIAINDVADMPLYFLVNTWAMRKELTYDPRMDEATMPTSIRPAPR